MLTTLFAPLRSLRRRVPGLEPYAMGTAWLFIVFTVAHLVWVIGQKWSDPSGLTTLYETTLTEGGIERTVHAWGLAYAGTLGILLAATQAIAVTGAAVVTALNRPGRARRIAHGVLIGWAAMWMLGLTNLAQIDPGPESFGQAMIASLFFAATLYRAVPRGLRVGDATAPAPPVPAVTAETVESVAVYLESAPPSDDVEIVDGDPTHVTSKHGTNERGRLPRIRHVTQTTMERAANACGTAGRQVRAWARHARSKMRRTRSPEHDTSMDQPSPV